MSRKLRIAMAGAVVVFGVIGVAGPAFGQDASESVKLLGTQVNLLRVVIGAVLVIFMQAGFALVETGFCRAEHAAHVVSTNFAIFGLGFVGYYLVGFGLMFGGYSLPLIGFDRPVGTNLIGSGNWVFLWQGGWAGSGAAFYTAGAMGFFLYMAAFMDTVATVPTGSMAERWKSFVAWGSSAARSTTHCSARGRGAAAGWPSSGRAPSSESAMSTSPAPVSSTPSEAPPHSPVPSCSVPASTVDIAAQ